jgi:hypothetical protein
VIDPLEAVIGDQRQIVVFRHGLQHVADQFIGALHHGLGVGGEGAFLMLFGIQLGEVQQQKVGMFLLQQENRGQGAGAVVQPWLGKGGIGAADFRH